MSRIFTEGNWFRLANAKVLSLPVGPPGVTFATWIKYNVTVTPAPRYIFAYNDTGGSPETRFLCRTKSSRAIWAQGLDSSGTPRETPVPDPGIIVPEDVWFPLVLSYRFEPGEGKYLARLVYPLLTAPLTTDGGDVYIHGLVFTRMGVGSQHEGLSTLNGKLAHFTIYGRGLTDEEIDSYLAGANPLSIDGAAHYWPMLYGTGNAEDVVNGIALSMVGTIGEDVADNPPVDSIAPYPGEHIVTNLDNVLDQNCIYYQQGVKIGDTFSFKQTSEINGWGVSIDADGYPIIDSQDGTGADSFLFNIDKGGDFVNPGEWTFVVPYYVDTINGSSGNNGLTPETAFKSIADIFSLLPQGEHTIYCTGGADVLSGPVGGQDVVLDDDDDDDDGVTTPVEEDDDEVTTPVEDDDIALASIGDATAVTVVGTWSGFDVREDCYYITRTPVSEANFTLVLGPSLGKKVTYERMKFVTHPDSTAPSGSLSVIADFGAKGELHINNSCALLSFSGIPNPPAIANMGSSTKFRAVNSIFMFDVIPVQINGNVAALRNTGTNQPPLVSNCILTPGINTNVPNMVVGRTAADTQYTNTVMLGRNVSSTAKNCVITGTGSGGVQDGGSIVSIETMKGWYVDADAGNFTPVDLKTGPVELVDNGLDYSTNVSSLDINGNDRNDPAAGAGWDIGPYEWGFSVGIPDPLLTNISVSDVTGDGCTVTVSTNRGEGKLYLSIRTAEQGGDYTEGDQALIRDGTVGVDCVYKDEVATPDYTVPQVFTVTGLDPGTTFHVGLAQDVDAV